MKLALLWIVSAGLLCAVLVSAGALPSVAEWARFLSPVEEQSVRHCYATKGINIGSPTTVRIAADSPVGKAGDIFRAQLDSGFQAPDMVVIPAGTFDMGDLQNTGDSDEKPVRHEVKVSRFAMGRYEITNQQYVEFLNQRKPAHAQRVKWLGHYDEEEKNNIVSRNDNYTVRAGFEQRPVDKVSWYGAKAYAAWLSEQSGCNYRLSSEAEWEYAARAGSRTHYPWGNQMGKNLANCDGCGSRWDDKEAAPVGSFAPNAFGLHDMHGNLLEWVEDCFHPSYQGAPDTAQVWEKGDCTARMLRGGAWFYDPSFLRSSLRFKYKPTMRTTVAGIRIVQDLH